MEIWLATGNSGKVKEYELLMSSIPGLKIHTQNEISGFSARPEDGKTFVENARIKAKTLRSVKNASWVFGEDSGLEVEGLGGLPGIHSARYAGPKASDSENVAKLLKMIGLRSASNRAAVFRCALVVYTPTGEEWIFEETMKGEITTKPQGLHGFGYDPVFKPEGQTQTLAELGAGFKNLHSHRSKCVKAFLAKAELKK